MAKRLFYLTTAAILLLILSPCLIVAALAIRLDSAGPIWYRSPRMGRHGQQFGLYRFRTVDAHRSATLPMAQRLTTVGRFIRNYSIDDFPNLFNIVSGDLSIIGPRPMEPERVDLTDPVWQQILTARPGMISPAILQLGRAYNGSSMARKQQLELFYVQQQSFGYDLRIFWWGLHRFFATKGNWKRGAPQHDESNGVTS
ncbi:MAG: sugar transferase [Caldilineaceae bacterium]|nr:sugar transferase [Caldilineaceae bacterium]